MRTRRDLHRQARGEKIGERSTDLGMPALHITAAEIEDGILGIAGHDLVEGPG